MCIITVWPQFNKINFVKWVIMQVHLYQRKLQEHETFLCCVVQFLIYGGNYMMQSPIGEGGRMTSIFQ